MSTALGQPAAPEVGWAGGRRWLPALLALTAVAATLLVAAALAGLGTDAPPTGVLDSGVLTRWGLPLARVAQDLFAVGTVGVLLAAAVLVPVGPAGRLTPTACRMLRLGARWARCWLVACIASLLLVYSDAVAVPVWRLGPAFDLDELYGLAPCRALLAVIVLTGVLSATAPASRTRAGAGVLLALGAVAVLPPLLAGHAVHGSSTRWTTVTLATHVLCAALWAGGLVAVGLHLRAERALLAVVGLRLSRVALPCSVLLVAAGVSTALSRGAFVLDSGYGRMLAAKAVVLVVVLALGGWQRWRTLALLQAGRPGAFARTCCVEALLLTSAVTLAAILSRTPLS